MKTHLSICKLSACWLFWGAILAASGATLQPGTVTSQGINVAIPISFSGMGSQVSALQWTISYSAADFTSINASIGPAASASGKIMQCSAPSAGLYTCIVAGMNANLIGDGIVATANLTISATTTDTSS